MYTHDQQLALDRYREYLRRAEEHRRHRGDLAPGSGRRAVVRRTPPLPAGRFAATVRRVIDRWGPSAGAGAALTRPE